VTQSRSFFIKKEPKKFLISNGACPPGGGNRPANGFPERNNIRNPENKNSFFAKKALLSC
jgi:hypothetical protein